MKGTLQEALDQARRELKLDIDVERTVVNKDFCVDPESHKEEKKETQFD